MEEDPKEYPDLVAVACRSRHTNIFEDLTGSSFPAIPREQRLVNPDPEIICMALNPRFIAEFQHITGSPKTRVACIVEAPVVNNLQYSVFHILRRIRGNLRSKMLAILVIDMEAANTLPLHSGGFRSSHRSDHEIDKGRPDQEGPQKLLKAAGKDKSIVAVPTIEDTFAADVKQKFEQIAKGEFIFR